MKKVAISLTSVIMIVVGFLVYNNLTKKDEKNVFEKYKEYTFHNISDYKKDLFQLEDYEIDDSLKTNTLDITIDDKIFNIFLLDDYLHIISDDIEYIYDEIGKVKTIMKFKSCNCNDECIKILFLTEDGILYYLDLKEPITDLNNIDILKKADLDYKIDDIGYIKDIKVLDKCGSNAVALKTNDKTTILGDKLEELTLDYYTYIGNEDRALFIYPDGSIKLYDKKYYDFDIKIEEAFVFKNIYYLIDSNKHLYKIEDNKLTKISSKKVNQIGYRIKKDGSVDRALVIYDDNFVKQYSVDPNYKPLNV